MQEINSRNIPETPGSHKSVMTKLNKPSKKRVTLHKEEIKALVGNCYSDMGGDGGAVYLLDYEELKKVRNDATGSTS